MRLKVIFGLVMMVMVGVLLAGCGGSSDSSSSGTDATGAESTAAEGDTTNANSNDGGGEEDGGNEESGSTTEAGESKPMTKTEFKTRVEEICIQVPPTYEEELKQLEKENGGKKPSKAETNLKAAIPPLESALGQMESLTPPAAEEQKLEETVTALQGAVKGLEEEPTAELSGPKSPFAEFQKVTKENGFETCSGL